MHAERSASVALDDAEPAESARDVAVNAATPTTPVPPQPEPVLVVSRPEELEPWRAQFDFGALLFAQPGDSTKALRRSPRYRSLIQSLNQNQRTNFPQWWLGHPQTHFELVGIVNRLDRRDMRPGTCGETRLLYRLEHRGEHGNRRLPASFNVVFQQPDDGNDCIDAAKAWFATDDAHRVLAEPGRPLHADRFVLENLLAVEVNLREDHPGTKETTNRLSVHGYDAAEDGFEREDFEFELHGVLWKGRGWRRLVDNLTSEETLASMREGTPRMRSRYPPVWDAIVRAPSPQPDFLLEAMRNARHTPESFEPFESAKAASHRMETLTCSGCHRQRSVGGFHLPGEGGASELHGGMSAHLLSELPWRRAYVEAVAAGESPDRVRKHPHAGPPGFGELCSTDDSPIADLSCQAQQRCAPVEGAYFGTCLPESYDGPGPCEAGTPECHGPSEWFPGGMPVRSCDDAHACAAMPTRADVRDCARDRDPWACANAKAQRVMVDSCLDQADCRDGYVCTRAEALERGVCRPAKAVAELRTRGHARVVR